MTTEDNNKKAGSTLKLYNSIENSLTTQVIQKPMKWIMNNPDFVIPKIKESKNKYGVEYSDHSLRTFFRYICIYTKDNPSISPSYKKNYDKYISQLENYSALVQIKYESHELNDKEKKAWVNWNDIIKKRDILDDQNEGSPQHLLLSMYTYIPPARVDYDKVMFYKYPLKPSDDAVKTTNYIIQNINKKVYIHLNEYKTSSTYNEQVTLVPNELSKIIINSFVKFPRNYLFETKQKKAYADAKQFSKWANRTLNTIFGKDGLTLTLLRKIKISYSQGLSVDEKNDVAKNTKPELVDYILETDIDEIFIKDDEKNVLQVVESLPNVKKKIIIKKKV
jgi:hypothetical protein